MSLWDRARARAAALLGRAEELYGESHGDAAATLGGEARRLEGEALEEQVEQDETHPEHRKDDDDGLASTR